MAPSARAVHKAEAKYGVTADYPDLQLHSAAANGNVGLVKYALMHGQPVNSVLNGVLPIHIAASSGNEVVVQMLIDAGADVNAARLPRKYNADRSKAISSIGAAGSTPLHFASANGHAHIVSLLLSHGANPDLTEKHGLTPEDLAREGGHVGVLTVFRLWKQRGNEMSFTSIGGPTAQNLLGVGSSASPTGGSGANSSNGSSGYQRDTSHQFLGRDLTRSSGPSIGSAGSGGGGGSSAGNALLSSAASIHSVASSTGRKLLAKPSMDSISSRGKKLAKAASNPNLAGLLSSNSSSNANAQHQPPHPPYLPTSTFAQAPVALRQNPSKALASYMSHGHGNTPLIHHVISLEKSRRPSLPSVFEKAAHPSQSIKQALGLTPTSGGNPFGHRSGSSSSRDNDPYHLGRAHRSTSKNSLAGIFKHHHHNKERSAEAYSQPLSPAASTFFTGDDELEQAEREAFLRADKDGESGEESTQLGQPSYTQIRPGSEGTRRTSNEGLTSARSRAGSASSAATSQSNRSYAGRTFDRANLGILPMTAPPTQTTFNNLDDNGPQSYSPRPGLSSYSSANSILIPQPIPAPPSSSTQPFFSKAAISAAHNNPPVARPGFYRPRKSSQLSTTASTVSNSTLTFSPDSENRIYTQSPRLGPHSDRTSSQDDYSDSTTTLVPPAVIIRKPSVKDSSTSSPVTTDSQVNARPTPISPRLASRETPLTSITSPPNVGNASTYSRTASSYTASTVRHLRSSSDGTSRQATILSDVQESPESQYRSNSRGPDTPGQENHSGSELDANGRRESEDVFPPDAERPFSSRSRANSRARVDSGPSAVPSINLTSSGSYYTLPNVPSGSYLQQPGGDQDAPWRGGTRAHRSDSTATTTDTRTSRSGSVGESGGPQQRFFGFDYSSSPTGSTASFKYHPSASTTATSLVSSPPGTAVSGSQGTTVTHAQAQFMVKRKQEELLSYDPSQSSQSSGSRRPSLSQQLAAYGDSLAIERELQSAEQNRQNPHEQIALTIPDPPASAKYSWEILGKESRTQMPVSKGQRAREKAEASSSVVQQQKLWTHRMVSPYEVPLNRPGTHVPGHRHTPSAGTITSGGKKDGDGPVKAMSGLQINVPSAEQVSHVPQSPSLQPTFHHIGDQNLRNKPSSTLSISRNYLAPPQAAGSSDLSVKKSPRLRSISPSQPSPRSSSEREREKPSTTYHVVAGPGSEPTDSANSSLVSEPRSGVRMYATGSNVSSRHRYSRSDPASASHSPEAQNALEEQTPRPPQLLRLETVSAPKFHIEQRAGGEAAPSPTKPKFGSKFGKLFK